MPEGGNYYEDGGAAQEPEAKPEAQDEPKDEKSEETALANKSAFPEGCKPGDTYTIEIVGEHDQEVEFKVTDSHEKPAEEMPPEAGEPAAGPMRSMLED
jgi:hypothetical protein